MSRIVSPNGPTQILITFDEQTGATGCSIMDSVGKPKFVPFQQVNAVFASLIVQFSEDAKKQGKLGAQEFAVMRIAEAILRYMKDCNRIFPQTPGETPAATPAGNGTV